METDSEVISNLKFIGRIGKHERINVQQLSVQPPGLVTSFRRTFIEPDTRGNCLNFCTNTLKRNFEIIHVKMASINNASRVAYCSQIIKDIETSKNGLNNLKITYTNDVKFCCDIDTLLQEVESKIEGLKTTSPQIFNYVPIEIKPIENLQRSPTIGIPNSQRPLQDQQAISAPHQEISVQHTVVPTDQVLSRSVPNSHSDSAPLAYQHHLGHHE